MDLLQEFDLTRLWELMKHSVRCILHIFHWGLQATGEAAEESRFGGRYRTNAGNVRSWKPMRMDRKLGPLLLTLTQQYRDVAEWRPFILEWIMHSSPRCCRSCWKIQGKREQLQSTCCLRLLGWLSRSANNMYALWMATTSLPPPKSSTRLSLWPIIIRNAEKGTSWDVYCSLCKLTCNKVASCFLLMLVRCSINVKCV